MISEMIQSSFYQFSIRLVFVNLILEKTFLIKMYYKLNYKEFFSNFSLSIKCFKTSIHIIWLWIHIILIIIYRFLSCSIILKWSKSASIITYSSWSNCWSNQFIISRFSKCLLQFISLISILSFWIYWIHFLSLINLWILLRMEREIHVSIS